MGKGALVTAAAVVFSTILMLFNSQVQSSETDGREYENRSLEMAKALAMTGRKLVLTNWIQANGANGAQPFADTLVRDGGKIWIEGYTFPNTDTLDFRVFGAYDSTVHEIRSRFAWKGFAMNPIQMKVGALDPTISNLATLDFSSIALDDQTLQEMEDVLVDDLGLITSLSDYGLGLTETHNALDAELIASGNGDKTIVDVDQAQRDLFDAQNGLFYPDQISQAVELHALANPSQVQTTTNVGDLNATFGVSDGMSMLTFEGDMTLTADFAGQGILVVEGNFVVPPSVTFSWDGVILVKPPQSNMSPIIDLSGTVNITGAVVALHEGLPNTGHMDLSVYRDMSGVWPTPFGQDFHDPELLQHTHDFTSLKGNRIVFHSDDPLEPDHEAQTYFNETLSLTTDSVFLEIFNPAAHGRGIIMLDDTMGQPMFQTAGSGFDELIVDPNNPLRTQSLFIPRIEQLDISITRLSSLKKMWDTGENYNPCNHPTDKTSGPHCVWSDFGRYGSLNLRMYTRNTLVYGERLVYEASMYWHRRTDEEEEFNDEMADLASSIQDPNYGLDFIIGDNTAIHGDNNAILSLGAFSGFAANFGVTNLGTWHRQWEVNDIGNPLLPSLSN